MQQSLFNPWYVDENSWGVEIIDESTKYKGTVIQIKSLEFPDDNSPEIALDFHIISKPEGLTDEDYKEQKFSDILQTVIEQMLRKVIEEHANRETNSK